MRTLRVNTSSPYDIFIGKGILSSCGEEIKKLSQAKKIAVISDSNVGKIYSAEVLSSLNKAGYETCYFEFKAGEENKTLATVSQMLTFLAQNGLTRKDLVVALGGGVCGDMAGFTASIYLRGIDFVQIPTSLLAQIDSSVGGKTGADLPAGKNLVGAFHQPILVLIDTDVLKTLPKEYFIDGMGEAIKYGAIKSKSLFERLEAQNPEDFLEEMIYQCVDIKREVVENDEKEHGERALLNFGHTFGHSLEKYYNYKGISHGIAVGIGMAYICKVFENKGITKPGTYSRIENLLQKYGMPTHTDAPLDKIIEGMYYDKKRSGDGIKFVILKEIGDSTTYFIKNNEIKEFFGV